MERLNSASYKAATLLLLSIATILFFNLYERYTVIGPELLQNGDFDNSSTGVTTTNPAVGSTRLHSDAPANFVYTSQDITDFQHYPLLRLSYEIKTVNVSRGPFDWMAARIVLLTSLNPNGTPTHLQTHVLTNIHGTHKWERHEVVFTTHADTSKLNVSAQLAKATGTFWVKNLSLLPVKETALFDTIRTMISILWIFLTFWIATPIALSALGNIRRTSVLILALAISFGALMPEAQKARIGNALLTTKGAGQLPIIHSNMAVFRFSPLLPSPDIYKAGHFVMFAFLSIAALSHRPYPISRIRTLFYLLLFAMATEVLQLLVLGRSAQLGDLIIDGAGIATALILLWVAHVFSQPAHD